MASKKSKVLSEVAPPTAASDYKPRLYLDLEKQDVSQIKGLAVGEEIEVVVTGKVVGLEQRERIDMIEGKEEKRLTGSIQLEGYRVNVMGEEDNEFKQMFAEDE